MDLYNHNEDTIERFSEVYWSESDIVNALDIAGLATTDENVWELYGEIDTEALQDCMVQAGWEYIYAARDYLERKGRLKYEGE